MKFLHVAFAVGGAWFRQNNKKGLTHTRTVACEEAVQFDVGGHKFTIQEADIDKYPSSMLYQMTQSAEEEIRINRSGALFQHVTAYLQYGQLPRGTDGKVMMDEQTLKELKTEADYFGLDTLSVECDSVPAPDFYSYFAIRDYLGRVMEEHKYNERAFTDHYISTVPPLAHALKCLWVPFCAVSELFCSYEEKFELNISDVVAAPYMSAIDGSQNCTSDVIKLNSTILDIIINQLQGASALKDLAPHLDLTLQLEELVIQQEGFAQEERRVLQSSKDTGLIGKLVLVLNSTYTGGELEVTHGGRTEVVTGPYSWVAMYGDCLHKINPVTSGTRATLTFDIVGKKREVYEDIKKSCFPIDAWFHRSRAKSANLISPVRPLSSEQQHEVLRCLEMEMKDHKSFVLGLQHQYHYNALRQMPTVDMLTGGDKALYEMLTSCGDYDVKLISATIQYTDGFCFGTTVKLFSPDITNYSSAWYDDDYSETGEDDDENAKPKGTAVVVPSVVNSDWILRDEQANPEFCGCTRECVYLISGLQISKRTQTDCDRYVYNPKLHFRSLIET